MNLLVSSPTSDIEVNHRYGAPLAKVIHAFSDKRVLEKWFAPDPGIQIHIPVFDFRPGGEFLINYIMPSGAEKSVCGTYTTINLPHEIAFTWVWQAPDDHAGLQTHVQIRFEAQGRDTLVSLTHRHLTTDSLKSRHRTGWDRTFQSMMRGVLHGSEKGKDNE